MNPPPIRFRFFGHGHDRPITGHLYLRWVEAEGVWRLSNWQRSLGSFAERRQQAGTSPLDGGQLYLEAISSFLEAWGRLQQASIDQHRIGMGTRKPSDFCSALPGFRPVSMARNWYNYKVATSEEVKKISQDIDCIIALLEQGWVASKITILRFPQFNFGDPWP